MNNNTPITAQHAAELSSAFPTQECQSLQFGDIMQRIESAASRGEYYVSYYSYFDIYPSTEQRLRSLGYSVQRRLTPLGTARIYWGRPRRWYQFFSALIS